MEVSERVCVTCGCDGGARPRIVGAVAAGRHAERGRGGWGAARADRDHGRAGPPVPGGPAAREPGQETDRSRLVAIEERVLAKNDALAAANRHRLAHQGILAVNLMSSPGAGKTTLLEHTIGTLIADGPIAVVEGDQEGALDADRIRAAGAPVVQVNTGDGCHLDAEMFDGGLRALPLAPGALVFVENVGNLVCPALFDLGEGARVVLTAVTEGDDKPAKYPRMFASADLVLINKCDLGPHVDFDAAACERRIRAANPRAEILAVSARTGDGLPAWYDWLRRRRADAALPACPTHHDHLPAGAAVSSPDRTPPDAAAPAGRP